MLKKLSAVSVVLVGAAFVLPALAQPSVELAVDVRSVRLAGECGSADGGDLARTWEVALSVTVHNTSEDVARFASTGFFVKFRDPSGSQQIDDDVTVVDSGGFVAGEHVDAGSSETFAPVVHASVPCDVTGADMFATLSIEGRDKTFVDGATFIENGTPVPLGPTGVLGIAVMIGVAGLLAQRLGRRPKPMRTDVGVG